MFVNVGLDVAELFELEDILDKKEDEGENIREFLYENHLTTDEILSEGTLGQEGFDSFDDIGAACEFLFRMRNGEEADIFSSLSEDICE